MTTAARDAADWRPRAACRGEDTDRWYGRPHETSAALTICARCAVRVECLHECLQTEVPTYRYGVFGGLTAAQRRALPAGAQDMTIAALHRLLDEIDEQGGPQAARDNRLTLTPSSPSTEPESTMPTHSPDPVRTVAVGIADALPLDQLLAWGDGHSDTSVQDQAARARAAFEGLRARHERVRRLPPLPGSPLVVQVVPDRLAVPAQVPGDRRDRPSLTTQCVRIHVFLPREHPGPRTGRTCARRLSTTHRYQFDTPSKITRRVGRSTEQVWRPRDHRLRKFKERHHPMCHQPTRSALAKQRGGIGGRCWRKLRPEQRAAIRREPGRLRTVLARPVPAADDQLSLEEESSQ